MAPRIGIERSCWGAGAPLARRRRRREAGDPGGDGGEVGDREGDPLERAGVALALGGEERELAAAGVGTAR
ncbi:MAG TPA: hypothetical protein VNT32_13395 [Thermoleophilaceae bacterium]|nr:hypothetical protein [Thermoleophilaceae bacterium]